MQHPSSVEERHSSGHPKPRLFTDAGDSIQILEQGDGRLIKRTSVASTARRVDRRTPSGASSGDGQMLDEAALMYIDRRLYTPVRFALYFGSRRAR
jgi:hypothetical protein